MLSFFVPRKDSKKSPKNKEVDESYVIVGETAEELRRKTSATNITQPSTNVIVQPSKVTGERIPAPSLQVGPEDHPPAAEAATTLPDLLGDIPFTLAPHVMALQTGFPAAPDGLMSRDLNYKLASFHYDFTLENSVLHD